MPKLISLIIPVYNEQENIPLIYQALVQQLKPLANDFLYELIFIDDGSSDQSLDLIKKLADGDTAVKYFGFSRNFGKEIAITAGLNHCLGDAAIIIDADLQHPPELILEFVFHFLLLLIVDDERNHCRWNIVVI